MEGIPFLITNYRKGNFLALFRDRSGAVRQYGIPHAREKSSKNALFSVLRIFAEKKSPPQRFGFCKANDRNRTLAYVDGSLTQQKPIYSRKNS